ncbi:MAG TPA: methyltransferase domain-containing protein [Dehalococcoidia bacterium]|jgi:SAM-dependent methyltransferase|nr:methyltransferase domain-containing protein [Dehalococcoidia bacterium]
MTTYAFDNAAPQAQTRFAALEACYDAPTQAHLHARGLGPGWHCLEIGAGSGSIARWLAHQVGSHGHVVATDIDTRWTGDAGLPQLEIRQHDIVSDALPVDTFDLIHARLVLGHLPTRDAVLARLAAALKPGGWLVLEDFDSCLPHCLDPLSEEERAFIKIGEALVQALHQRGADTTWPRTLPHRLRTVGLRDVGASGHLVIYHGGSPAALLQQANLDQVGDALVAAGLITAGELDLARRLLDSPAFIVNHPLMITTWGRKPA